MAHEEMNDWGVKGWGDTGGTALLERSSVRVVIEPAPWATTPVAGFDDDLDEDESYFLETDDDDDDDGYDDDDGGDFEEDEDADVDVELDDDDDDDL